MLSKKTPNVQHISSFNAQTNPISSKCVPKLLWLALRTIQDHKCQGRGSVKPQTLLHFILQVKGGVCHFGETSSSALEFESTQPKKICPFLQTSLQSPSSNTHERAHDQ